MFIPKIKIYFAKEYLKILLITIFFSSILIFILDLAEIIRVTYNHSLSLLSIIILTSAKYMSNIITLTPIIILIATILVFYFLAKRNEMITMVMLQISHIHIIISIVIIIAALYIFQIFVLLPLNTKLSLQSDMLFLKQNTTVNKHIFFKNSANQFIKIESLENNQLKNISVWILNKNFELSQTILSKYGEMTDKNLILYDSQLIIQNSIYLKDQIILDIQSMQIYNNNLKPEQIEFFELPTFIKILKICGVQSAQYERYFYNHVYAIITCLSMGLIGFASSYKVLNRYFNKMKIFYGIITGLSIFFFTSFFLNILLSCEYNILFSVITIKFLMLSFTVGHVLRSYYN